MRTAKDLKIGDQIRKEGRAFIVRTIEDETYKNGTKSLMVGCELKSRPGIVDTHFHFKLTTKI